MATILISGGARTSQEIMRRLINASVSAVKRGMTETRNALRPTVAKDTGALRQSIDQMFDRQSIKIVGARSTLTIEFKQSDVRLSYAQYHINPGGRFSSYRNPTTEGTKPVNKFNVDRDLKTNIEKALPIELIRQGVRVV